MYNFKLQPKGKDGQCNLLLRPHERMSWLASIHIIAFGATGGAVFLSDGASPKLAVTRGVWNGEAALCVVLGTESAQVGEIALAAQKGGLD